MCFSYMLTGEVSRKAGPPSSLSPAGPKIFNSAARKAEILDALVKHEVTETDLLHLCRYSQRTLYSIDVNQQLNIGISTNKEADERIDLEAPELEIGKIDRINSMGDSNNPGRNESLGFLASAECSICMEEYSWSRNLSCNHAFHTDCLESWLICHDICPNSSQNLIICEICEASQATGEDEERNVLRTRPRGLIFYVVKNQTI
jgi:hypothetical protein